MKDVTLEKVVLSQDAADAFSQELREEVVALVKKFFTKLDAQTAGGDVVYITATALNAATVAMAMISCEEEEAVKGVSVALFKLFTGQLARAAQQRIEQLGTSQGKEHDESRSAW